MEDIANSTTFNGTKLTDGSAAALTIQTGLNSGDKVSVAIGSMKTADLAGTTLKISAVDMATRPGAEASLAAAEAAITSVNAERAKLGAVQNRSEAGVSSLVRG